MSLPRATRGGRAEPAHRLLERERSPVGRESDHLAVEHGRVEREPPRRRHDLRNAVGDVGEAAREGTHLVSRAVHLEPRAVELPLDPRRPGARERLRDVCRRLGQHRPDRAQHLEPEAAEALVPVDERRPRDDREVAREHVRPTNVGGGEPGGPRDRVDHHTGQRALP